LSCKQSTFFSVQVRGGSSTGPLLTRQRLCGINETQSVIEFNGPMYISFSTDSSITATGFSAEISGRENKVISKLSVYSRC